MESQSPTVALIDDASDVSTYSRMQLQPIVRLWRLEDGDRKLEQVPTTKKKEKSLKRHQRAYPDKNSELLSCNLCHKTYKSELGLQIHVRAHTGEKPFACRNCPGRFHSYTALGRHRTRFHLEQTTSSSASHICHVCQRQFTRPSGLSMHMTTQHETNPPAYSCDECGATFKIRSYLRSHKLSHIQEGTEKCTFCSSWFKTRSNLMAHIKRRHTGEKLQVCPASQCTARFCTRAEMMVHNKRVHLREKPHSCPQCAKCFAERGDLVRHQLTHTVDRPYLCNTCGKGFGSTASCYQHLRSHLGEKPHPCTECGKRFTSTSHLTRHMRSLHEPDSNRWKRQCGICSKFLHVDSLREHEQIHTRDESQRPFTCEICSKSYYTRRELRSHMISHGPRKHACLFCSKAFHAIGTLKEHLLTHTGETRTFRSRM